MRASVHTHRCDCVLGRGGREAMSSCCRLGFPYLTSAFHQQLDSLNSNSIFNLPAFLSFQLNCNLLPKLLQVPPPPFQKPIISESVTLSLKCSVPPLLPAGLVPTRQSTLQTGCFIQGAFPAFLG